MVAVGYTRVSTDKQADNGISLEAQEAKIRAQAVVSDLSLLDVIVDAGQSASTLDRPGMQTLLSLVKSRKVGFVVVAKLDRLTRSVRDLDELLTLFRKYKVELFSLSEFLNTATAMGRFALNMMVVVSQWEREAIGERTREALGHKRANRLRAGNIPYGFRLSADKQHVEPDKSEHEIIATIQKLRARGLTLRDIAAELNKRGQRTRRESYWRHEYVKRVLGGVSK